MLYFVKRAQMKESRVIDSSVSAAINCVLFDSWLWSYHNPKRRAQLDEN